MNKLFKSAVMNKSTINRSVEEFIIGKPYCSQISIQDKDSHSLGPCNHTE
jgi:hypothetical protein